MLKNLKALNLKDKRVVISGSGNVGSNAAIKAHELGALVVGMSDISGTIYSEEGLDVSLAHKIKKERKLLKEYPKYKTEVKYFESYQDLWKIKCDIALPCATQNEINLEEAKMLVENGVLMVCEGANMPCNIEAIHYFQNNNVLLDLQSC